MRGKPLAIVLTVLGAVNVAGAALIGILPGFPNLLFESQGGLSFSNATRIFSVDSCPIAIQFVPGDVPEFVTGADVLTIQAEIAADGSLVGGVPGDDFVLQGDVVTPNGPLSGVLLTGEVVQFGFQDTGGEPAQDNTDFYDFRFTVTGGLLVDPWFLGSDIGLVITSDNSTFTDDFTVDFAGDAQGGVGPIAPIGVATGACCLPDGTCDDVSALLCAAAGGAYQGDGTTCFAVSCVRPGWNSVDVQITLTRDQPIYWSALTGQPAGVSPFTILDPYLPPGRPAGDGTDDRVLRGYVVAWAVDAQGRELNWNHLKGDATIVNYEHGYAWEYNAWAFQAAVEAPGALLNAPFGQLDLDGVEYVPAYSVLLLDFLAAGSTAISGGNPLVTATVNTDLVLHPVDVDLRQENGGPVTTKATLVVWNENETQFTGLDRCLTCWDGTMLALYSAAQNHFLLGNLQTDKGKARIDGLASTLCSSNCCIARPMTNPDSHPGCASVDCQELVCAVDATCCTTEWDDDCVWIAISLCAECEGPNRAAPLLGVAAKKIELSAGGMAASALNLVGMGAENARISFDPGAMGPPPVLGAPAAPTSPDGDAFPGPTSTRSGYGSVGFSAGARDDAGTAAAPVLGPGADRVSGTEKGSLLIYSTVEIRWTPDGLGGFRVSQDTFLDMANDFTGDVQVQMYFVNGDPPIGAGP